MGDQTDEAHGARRQPGWRALPVVACSALLGVMYVGYLNVEPYPLDIIRIVPFAWLIGTLLGCIDAIHDLRKAGNRPVAVSTLILGVPSAFVACIFVMGALMGD